MLARLVAALMGLVCVAAGAAEPICYQYRRTTADPWTTAGGADAQILAWCYNEGGSSYNCSSSGLSKSSQSCTFTIAESIGADEESPFSALVERYCTTIPAGVVVSDGQVSVSGLRREDPEGCPDDPCADEAGKDAFVGIKTEPGEHCLGGCAVAVTPAKSIVRCSVTGACTYASVAQSTFTGSSCTDQEPATPGNCVSGSFGRMCIKESPDGNDNCGIFNGDRVCVDSIESGCQSYASGGMACVVEGEGATTELPDDGDSSPAQPQMQVERDGKVVNYYNSSTVSNSSVSVVGSQPTGANGTGDGGSGGGLGGDGVEECTGEDECYGGLPDEAQECADDLVACIGAHASNAFDTVVDGVPVLSFAASLHSAFGTSASCPTAPVTIFEETHDAMAPICALLDAQGGLFELIMQICWGILGLRILLVPQGEGDK